MNDSIRTVIARLGRREAFRELVARNDARILGPEPDNGREVARTRSAIHLEAMVDQAREQQAAFG